MSSRNPLSARYPGLEGQTIVVTGAARGQGAAEAGLLANQGAHVLALDTTPEAPSEFAKLGIDYREFDVTDESQWRGLCTELARTIKAVRGLVNNAGITHRARISDTERDDWDRVFAVNVTGPMLGIRSLAPHMSAGSSIVNVGSIAGLSGHYTAAYTASKWALRGLSRVAATEYGARGIRVNTIHPGFIETPMTSNAPDAMRSAQLELTPLERFGEVDDVAHIVAFLLSDAAAYVSGAEIPVDGAFTSSASAKYMADQITRGQG